MLGRHRWVAQAAVRWRVLGCIHHLPLQTKNITVIPEHMFIKYRSVQGVGKFAHKFTLGRTTWALLNICCLHSHENSKACGSFSQQVHKWLLDLQKAFDCVEPWGILFGVL